MSLEPAAQQPGAIDAQVRTWARKQIGFDDLKAILKHSDSTASAF
jgi:hypothetical protein